MGERKRQRISYVPRHGALESSFPSLCSALYTHSSFPLFYLRNSLSAQCQKKKKDKLPVGYGEWEQFRVRVFHQSKRFFLVTHQSKRFCSYVSPSNPCPNRGLYKNPEWKEWNSMMGGYYSELEVKADGLPLVGCSWASTDRGPINKGAALGLSGRKS